MAIGTSFLISLALDLLYMQPSCRFSAFLTLSLLCCAYLQGCHPLPSTTTSQQVWGFQRQVQRGEVHQRQDQEVYSGQCVSLHKHTHTHITMVIAGKIGCVFCSWNWYLLCKQSACLVCMYCEWEFQLVNFQFLPRLMLISTQTEHKALLVSWHFYCLV